MLPFLKPKKISAVIMTKIKPEGGMEPIKEGGESAPELMGLAEELISAIHAKDAQGVAEILSALGLPEMGEVEPQ